jgi:hypothetical protein
MLTEEEHLNQITGLVTRRVTDLDAYIRSVKGKKLKHEFRKLVRRMDEADELWEWEWYAQVGPRDCYSLGWCILRNAHAIAYHCHSSS